jgi:hypothetical protein
MGCLNAIATNHDIENLAEALLDFQGISIWMQALSYNIAQFNYKESKNG